MEEYSSCWQLALSVCSGVGSSTLLDRRGKLVWMIPTFGLHDLVSWKRHELAMQRVFNLGSVL